MLNFEGIIQFDNQNPSEPLSSISPYKPDSATNSMNMTLERENAKVSLQLGYSSMNMRQKSNSTPLSPENEKETVPLNVDHSSINKESPTNEKANANLSLQHSLTEVEQSSESIALTPVSRNDLNATPTNENDQNTDNMVEKSPSVNKEIFKSSSLPNLVIDNSENQTVIEADDENNCSSMLQVQSSASDKKGKKRGTIKKQNIKHSTFSECTLARPKRRAVSMITDFKEPSLTKKLRR